MSDTVKADVKTADPIETPPESTPTDLEKRLSTIIGVTNDLRQSDSNRNAEIAGLKEVIVGLSQKIEGMAPVPAPSAPPATKPVDPFSTLSTTPDPVASPSPDFQSSVNAAVQEALKPLMTQSTAQNERLKKHQASYAKVVERDPAFSDPTAREKQLFDQIYNARPDIQQLPDAPAIIAESVRGILADERLDAQNVELAKARSTLPSAGGRTAPAAEPEKVREAYNQLVEKGKTTPLTRKERGDYLNLATAVAHLDEEN